MATLEPAARIIQRIGCCHGKINGMAEKCRVHVDETQTKIDTLLSQIEQSVAAVKALRVKCHAENNCEKTRLFPRLRKNRTSFRMDKNAFHQGMEQGKKNHVHRPVEHEETGITAFLP